MSHRPRRPPGVLLREVAEPVKRRVRDRGRDQLAVARRRRRAEEPVDFDIDVVITWVDDSDPGWRDDRDGVLSRQNPGRQVRDAAVEARFRNLGELRYTLRALEAHMPWVRQVVMVTSGQPLPTWLAPASLRVVTHAEILPDSALPTFNSHAIESALWRIDGLADHFVYLNDDVMALRPIAPNDLFSPEGRARYCLTRIPIPDGPPALSDSAAVAGARRARDLLADHGVGVPTLMMAHTPVPMVRSLHAELEGLFHEALAATGQARIRSVDDVPPVFLHLWYALLTGRAEPVLMTSRYVELSHASGAGRLERELGRRDVDYLCANLAGDPPIPWAQLAVRVTRALESRLPVASRFER